MPTLKFPLSWIEGHAQVVIEVQGGKVVSAYFQTTEFRGFDHLVKGVPAEDMVVIVPRICGVCSTAHHVAAVEALEDAYGVTPPPLARNIRELLLLGQLIQNQATSLFIFTMPDRLGTESIFQIPDQADTAQPMHIAQGVAQVRKAGTNLINVMAIEQALRVAAERYITAERIDMELEHAVGRVVRAFDPCIACATH